MATGREDPRKFGLYLALAQAGLEMVAPLGLGVFLDRLLGWTPWLTIGGAIVGFLGGLAHMVVLAQQLNRNNEAGTSSGPTTRGPR